MLRLAAVVLGDRERDPLERRQREAPVAQLGPEAGVGPQRGRGAGEHAQEVRQLPARGRRALQHGQRALWGGEVVVDVEPAHLRLHGNPWERWGGSRVLTLRKCTTILGFPQAAQGPVSAPGCAASRPGARRCVRLGAGGGDGDEDEHEAEHERPGHDPLGARTDPLGRGARGPPALDGGERERARGAVGAAGDDLRAAAVRRALLLGGRSPSHCRTVAASHMAGSQPAVGVHAGDGGAGAGAAGAGASSAAARSSSTTRRCRGARRARASPPRPSSNGGGRAATAPLGAGGARGGGRAAARRARARAGSGAPGPCRPRRGRGIRVNRSSPPQSATRPSFCWSYTRRWQAAAGVL